MGRSASVLFSLIDQELDRTTKEIYGTTLSISPEIATSPARRDMLQSTIRRTLDELVQGFFGVFDNVGSVLPEDVPGFLVVDVQFENDIRTDSDDYAAMWLDYLAQTPQKQP